MTIMNKNLKNSISSNQNKDGNRKLEFVFDLNRELRKQIQDSNIIKYGLIVLGTTGTIICLGYAFRILNFTISNYIRLRNTLVNK